MLLVYLIDEIDAVGRKRGSGQGGGNDERETNFLTNFLQRWMDLEMRKLLQFQQLQTEPEILDRALNETWKI